MFKLSHLVLALSLVFGSSFAAGCAEQKGAKKDDKKTDEKKADDKKEEKKE